MRGAQWAASGSVSPTGGKGGISWAVVISELDWEKAHTRVHFHIRRQASGSHRIKHQFLALWALPQGD